MGFADNLRTIRKERNISQEDLAERLGVSRQAVSKWEQGMGYPEMEKMIMLSKELKVSLDFLVSGKQGIREVQKRPAYSTGKIMIKTQDGKSIIHCIKVSSFCLSNRLFKSGPDEPQYALYGIDAVSFLGENRVILGWYADEDSIKKEIDAISAALNNGDALYELKYAAEVKKKFLSVKLVKK